MYLGKIFFVSQIFNLPRWLVVQETLNLIFIEIISPDFVKKKKNIFTIIYQR